MPSPVHAHATRGTTGRMFNLLKLYAYSAAFYLFALAAQVSGFTNSAVAVGLAVLATMLLAIPAWKRIIG